MQKASAPYAGALAVRQDPEGSSHPLTNLLQRLRLDQRLVPFRQQTAPKPPGKEEHRRSFSPTTRVRAANVCSCPPGPRDNGVASIVSPQRRSYRSVRDSCDQGVPRMVSRDPADTIVSLRSPRRNGSYSITVRTAILLQLPHVGGAKGRLRRLADNRAPRHRLNISAWSESGIRASDRIAKRLRG